MKMRRHITLFLFASAFLVSDECPNNKNNSLPAGLPHHYTVMVGRFAKSEAASALATQLRASRISNFTLSRKGEWIVCVGKYSSPVRANRIAEDLKSRGWKAAVVLPPKRKSS